MKRLAALLFVTFICAAQVHAVPDVEIKMAKDEDSKPTTTFYSNVEKVYAFFHSTGTKKGDTLRGVFIATDVGDAAPAETKIAEDTVTADKDNFSGAFSLSKPTKGWPVGSYRIEIYSGDQFIRTVAFSILASDDEDDDDDKD